MWGPNRMTTVQDRPEEAWRAASLRLGCPALLAGCPSIRVRGYCYWVSRFAGIRFIGRRPFAVPGSPPRLRTPPRSRAKGGGGAGA